MKGFVDSSRYWDESLRHLILGKEVGQQLDSVHGYRVIGSLVSLHNQS